MKKRTSKLLSLFLALVMVLGMLPTTVFAYSLTHGYCAECEEWFADDVLCDECYTCPDCIVSLAGHCLGCGGCFNTEVEFCEDSTDAGGCFCIDCCKNDDLHCEECEDHIGDNDSYWCPYAGQGSHCITCIASEDGETCNACAFLYCPFCENFEYCDTCGFCGECNAADFGGEAYCTDCGGCLQCIGGHDHFCTNCHSCESCSNVCEKCGECCSNCADVFCEGCNTCGECAAVCPECEEQCSECNSSGICGSCYACGNCAVICSDCGEACNLCGTVCEGCGGYCSDCADICENCGEVCSSCGDLCEDCGLCVNCCAENSECSEGMCAESSDYAEHFCSICYHCFHEVDPCEYCLENVEYYCEDCCAEAAEKAGCDCDEGHISDLQAHMADKHGVDSVITDIDHDAGAEPIPFTRWEYDVTHHWHACRACDPEAPFEGHITEKAAHTYGADKKCTVCGCPDGSEIMIRKQPKNAGEIPVSPVDGEPFDELGVLNNYVTFTVEAKSFNPKVTLSYQWYRCYEKEDGTEVAQALTDDIDYAENYDGDEVEIVYRSGTKTNTLRLTTTECTPKNTYHYYCEISDGNGHSVTTNRVTFSTTHVFSAVTHEDHYPYNEVPLIEMENESQGWAAPLYLKHNGSNVTINPAPSTGYHARGCLGDGCLELDESTKEPHTMGEPVKYEGYTAKDSGNQIYYQECTECGWCVYYEEHEHDLEYSVYGITDETHVLECKKCDFSIIEPHTFGAWMPDEHGHPSMERNCPCGKEINAKEATEDGSTSYIDPEKIDEGGYVLFTPVNGSLDRNAAKWGDTVQYTAEKNGKPCLGPTLLFAANSHNEILEYADESWGSFTPLLGESDTPLTWSLTLAEERPADYPEQEDPQDIISLVIKFEYGDEVCNHKVYDEIAEEYTDEYAKVLCGAKEAACNEDGYTGDWVCERCGVILEKGSVLPKSPKSHVYDPDSPSDENSSWDYDYYECEVCGTEFKIPHNRLFKIEVIGGIAIDDDSYTTVTKMLQDKVVHIQLDDTQTPEGKEFYKWVVTKGKASDFTEKTRYFKKTDFMMPANDLIIEATYKEVYGDDEECLFCHTTGAPKCTDCGERCGNCSELCQTCGRCEECAATCILCESACSKCSEVCENCYKCLTCSGASGICDDCRKCGNCVALCPNCESACSDCADVCLDCGWCEGCTIICPNCHLKCSEHDLVCIGCGLCEDCTEEICPECGRACSECSYICLSCGKCIDCCEESRFEYTMLEGDGQTVAKGNSAVFRSSAPFDIFGYVTVDNDDVDPSDYTAESGSTVITLSADFIRSLDTGEHEIWIVSNGGFAYGEFTVTRGGGSGGSGSGGSGSGTNPGTGGTEKPAGTGKDPWSDPFVDVSERDWFYDDVRFAYENGLMNGTGRSTFSPSLATTRGMIVTILWRLEGKPAASGVCPFDDVKSGSYYEDAITWAAENGIVNGYGKGKFGPDDRITREQMAAILWRYAKYKGYDVSVGENTNILSYADAFDISGYAYPALQWACGEGLINGYNGNLTPSASATRAQVAAILHRFLVKVVK